MTAQLTIAIVTLVVSVSTLVVFVLNMQINRKMFFANNHNQLVSILQEQKVRDARHHVVERLAKKDFGKGNWSEQDKEVASIVCGAYGTVGVFVELGKVRIEDIVSYRINLLECYDILKPFIMNRKTKSGEQYWSHFTYVAERLKKS